MIRRPRLAVGSSIAGQRHGRKSVFSVAPSTHFIAPGFLADRPKAQTNPNKASSYDIHGVMKTFRPTLPWTHPGDSL
jgi:hypothetical protein